MLFTSLFCDINKLGNNFNSAANVGVWPHAGSVLNAVSLEHASGSSV